MVDYRPTTRSPFADIELYFMGLKDSAEVAPVWFALDPTLNTSIGQILPRAKVTQVTMNDIISVYGTRTPAMVFPQTSSGESSSSPLNVHSLPPSSPTPIASENSTAVKWKEWASLIPANRISSITRPSGRQPSTEGSSTPLYPSRNNIVLCFIQYQTPTMCRRFFIYLVLFLGYC